MNRSGSEIFIVDNSDTDWKVSSYRRTGHLIEETTRSLINGLLRAGSIEKDGQDWIRRV